VASGACGVTTTASVSAPPDLRLSDDDLPLVSVQHEGKDEGDKKEDSIHDAEGPASLEHSACLVDIGMKRVATAVDTIWS